MSGVHGETLCDFCITNYNFKPKPVEKNRSIDNISAIMCILVILNALIILLSFKNKRNYQNLDSYNLQSPWCNVSVLGKTYWNQIV